MSGLLWQAGGNAIGARNLRIGCVGESYSFAPLGLVCFPLSPRLARLRKKSETGV
jgi:hypothetical protein